jgi:integrase
MRLTALSVPTLGPGEHRDEKGLVLRVRKTGARSWAVRYHINGRGVRYTLGRVKLQDGDAGLTLKQAKDRMAEVLAQVAAGRDPQAQKVAERRAPKPGAPLTVEQLGEAVLKHLKDLRPRTRRTYEQLAAKRIYPAFGRLPADSLTRGMIRRWSDKIAKKAPVIANRSFELLRRFYTVGVARDFVNVSPITHGMERPTKETPRDRVLSIAELWALRKALDRMPGVNSDIVFLLLLTGVRKAMVVSARREEFVLDGPEPRWVIPGGFSGRMKSKREHIVPLSPTALEIVRAHISDSPVLFPAGKWRGSDRKAKAESKRMQSSHTRGLERHMNEALVSAGLPPAPRWTLHDFRRAIATHMVERLGVAIHVVSAILGHKVLATAVPVPRVTTDVYMKAPFLRERREALERWDEDLRTLPDPRTKVVAFKEEAKR